MEPSTSSMSEEYGLQAPRPPEHPWHNGNAAPWILGLSGAAQGSSFDSHASRWGYRLEWSWISLSRRERAETQFSLGFLHPGFLASGCELSVVEITSIHGSRSMVQILVFFDSIRCTSWSLTSIEIYWLFHSGWGGHMNRSPAFEGTTEVLHRVFFLRFDAACFKLMFSSK